MASDSKAASFVNGLGWILVAFMGFGVCMTLMQNVMINFMLPAINEQVSAQPGAEQMPAVVMILFRVLAAFLLCMSALLLWAAWAFLKRRNWARRTWVVIFALNVASSAFGVLASLGLGLFQKTGPGFPTQFETLARVMSVFFAIMSIGFVVLFVWLIKRLRSPDVCAEFQSPIAS